MSAAGFVQLRNPANDAVITAAASSVPILRRSGWEPVDVATDSAAAPAAPSLSGSGQLDGQAADDEAAADAASRKTSRAKSASDTDTTAGE